MSALTDQWLNLAAVFIIVWWLVLFMILPWGVRPPDMVEQGHAESAPERPRIGLKMLITTVIALLLTPIVLWLVQAGIEALRPA